MNLLGSFGVAKGKSLKTSFSKILAKTVLGKALQYRARSGEVFFGIESIHWKKKKLEKVESFNLRLTNEILKAFCIEKLFVKMVPN